MEEKVYIQIESHKLIYKIGVVITILALFIIAGRFQKMNYHETVFFIIGFLVLIVIGFSMLGYRTYEKGTIDFIPEGIIINSKIGYIPLKYKQIKRFKSLGKDEEDNTQEFVIETEDNRKYTINAKADLYNGLVEIFPDKL